MSIHPIVLSIPVFFILIGMEVAYDRWKQRGYYRLADALTNISCGITEQVSGVFLKVFTIAVYYFAYEHLRIATIPNTWYWGFVLFLGVDFFYYWAHRLSHDINLLWAGHVVHHQSEDYNLSVALRQGFMQKIFTAIIYWPLAIAGFSTELFLLYAAFNTLYQFWIHTQTIGKLGPLEWIFNTPSHHRVHHGREPKYIDKNHAGILIIWDKLFGTFQKEEEAPVYGTTTPVNSWNPVYAQVHHFSNMAEDWKKVNGWDKWRLLWNKPGWLPDYAGGSRTPQPVVAGYEKFTVLIPLPLQLYTLLHYVILLTGTAWYLFRFTELSVTEQWMGGFAIVISVASLGSLLERSKSAVPQEIARCVLIPIFAGGLQIISIPAALLLLVVGISSLLWLYKIKPS